MIHLTGLFSPLASFLQVHSQKVSVSSRWLFFVCVPAKRTLCWVRHLWDEPYQLCRVVRCITASELVAGAPVVSGDVFASSRPSTLVFSDQEERRSWGWLCDTYVKYSPSLAYSSIYLFVCFSWISWVTPCCEQAFSGCCQLIVIILIYLFITEIVRSLYLWSYFVLFITISGMNMDVVAVEVVAIQNNNNSCCCCYWCWFG